MTTATQDISSKKTFTPESGAISGLLVEMQVCKGEVRNIRVETVRGTFQARLSKSLRIPMGRELELHMPVRLWLRVKGRKVRADLIIPLEPKKVVCTAPEACIWVCTSKSCCRKGGDQLLKSLQEAAQHQPPETRLQIKQCGCLGACKKGPTLKVKGDRKLHQVAPRSAPEWLAAVLQSRN